MKFELNRTQCLDIKMLNSHTYITTSMMGSSQNFLLYNGTVIKIKVNESINNFKKYVNPPPPLEIYTTCTNYNNLISKKSKRF